MMLALFNAACGLLVAGIVTVKLLRWSTYFNALERVGMGMLAAAMLLTIPTLVVVRIETPFDEWSDTLLRAGAALYFVGRMIRRHVQEREARRC